MDTPQSVAEKMRLWLQGAERVLLVGVGNESRGDDGAGVLVAQAMEKHVSSKLRVMNLEEAPARLLPDAIDFAPSHIIVVDATMFNALPGSVRLMRLDEMERVRSSSTHDLPVSVAVGLVTSEIQAKSIAIGIQPKTVCVGCEMSTEVRRACGQVVSLLDEQLASLGVI
jgi:hydrogenase 3 maturation protease